VLHTAHWDHLGRCTANAAGDDICNGAIDNATGVAALVALAEAHAKAGAAARTLVFMAVTAEESGLLGSEYYGANPVFPLAQTVGGLNMDALSLAGPARDVTVVGGGKSELDAILAAALAEVGRTATPDARRRRATTIARITSASPSAACRCSTSTAARTSSTAAAPRARRGRRLPRAGLSPARRRVRRGLNCRAWLPTMSAVLPRRACARAIGCLPNWYPQDEFRRIRDQSCRRTGDADTLFELVGLSEASSASRASRLSDSSRPLAAL
jgi:hypothetical protein